MDQIKTVIVQAGGKGSRMGHLTDNKPKCLVSLNGQPILYSIGEAFGNSIEAKIIADYKADVLESYIKFNPPNFSYSIIKSSGKGTSSGLQNAIDDCKGKPFAIVWSDLYFHTQIDYKRIENNSIGLTNSIRCRWSYENGELVERPNDQLSRLGIPGIFFFPKPEALPSIPENGEFVKFLSENGIALNPIVLKGFREIGTFESYRLERNNQFNSRFFNKIEVLDSNVVKTSRNASFKHLLQDEANWYQYLTSKGFTNIPKFISSNPLTIEYIKGRHAYDFGKLSQEMKESIVSNILNSLSNMHNLGSVDYEWIIAKEVYVEKTLNRIKKILNLFPKLEREYYSVNGTSAFNILHPEGEEKLEVLFQKLFARGDSFNITHGDPTFSNILIGSNYKPVFIDPRGSFGSLKIYGDPLYDYAKLYYSAIGNYDFFNQGRFILRLNFPDVDVKVESEGFESTIGIFEDKLGKDMMKINALHALIWLSLAGYVLDDYDSILASYFNGIRLFQEVYDAFA